MESTRNSLGFAALYRAHFGFVWSSLGRLGVASASIDDASQDVFVVAHRRLPGFEGRSDVRTWLFGIARRVAFRHRRTAIRHARKRRAAESLARTSMPSLGGGIAVDLDEAMAGRQAGALVLRALHDLDDDKRAAVVLHLFDELSGPQVAAMLGLNIDTAYSRIRAGRRALRTRLLAMGVREDHGDAVASAREQTRAARGTRDRVATLLSARLGRELAVGIALGSGAAPSSAAVSVAAWKGAALAVGLGVLGIVGVRGVSPPSPHAGEDALRKPKSAQAHRARMTAVRAMHLGDVPPDPESAAHPPRTSPPQQGSDPRPATVPAVVSEPGSPASPAAHPTRTARRSDPREPKSTRTDRLSREVGLLEAIRGALDHGEGEGALRLLAQHAERFPNGQLVTEHAAYRAVALCTVGRTAQGRGEARLFVRRHPQALLVGRLREACALSQKQSSRR